MSNQFLGASLNISQAPTGQMQSRQVSAFANDAAAKASTNAAAAAIGVAEQATKMKDYKSRIDGIDSMDDIRQRSEDEAMHALSVAPGHADSFFYANGEIIKEKVDDFSMRYTQEYEAVAPQFTTRDLDLQWEAERNGYMGNSLKRLAGRAASHEASSIRRSSTAIIENALKKGDYNMVAIEAQRQKEAGILSEVEANSLLFELNDTRILSNAQNIYNSDVKKFVEDYDARGFDNASRDAKIKIESLYRKASRASGWGEAPSKKTGANGSRKEKVKAAPWAIPEELYAVWDKHGGSFSEEAMQDEVRPELEEFIRKVAHTNPRKFMDANTIEAIEHVVLSFGGDAEYSEKLMSQIQKEMNDPAEYDPHGVFASVDYKYTFTEASQKNLNDLRNRKKELKIKEKKDKLSSQENVELYNIESDLLEWGGHEEKQKNRMMAVVKSEYTTWRQQNPDSNYSEQATAAWKIFGSHSSSPIEGWDIRNEELKRATRYNSELARDDADSEKIGTDFLADVAATDNERSLQQKALHDGALSMQLGQDYRPVARREDYTSEPVIYVPSKSGLPSVLEVNHAGVGAYAKVVEVEGLESPVMSAMLRGQLGDLPGKNRGLSIQGKKAILTPNVKDGNARAKNYKTGQWAGDMNVSNLPRDLQPYAQDFIEAGEKYGVNPALLAAISWHETAGGTSSAFRNKNNAMGISNARGVVAQSSVRASIDTMARIMGGNSKYKGRSLAEIGGVYAPIGAGNDPTSLNQHWERGVSRYLKNLTI